MFLSIVKISLLGLMALIMIGISAWCKVNKRPWPFLNFSAVSLLCWFCYELATIDPGY